MSGKPRNPFKAEPFHGVDLPTGGVMVARPGNYTLKNIEKYATRELAETRVLERHGRRIEWRR